MNGCPAIRVGPFHAGGSVYRSELLRTVTAASGRSAPARQPPENGARATRGAAMTPSAAGGSSILPPKGLLIALGAQLPWRSSPIRFIRPPRRGRRVPVLTGAGRRRDGPLPVHSQPDVPGAACDQSVGRLPGRCAAQCLDVGRIRNLAASRNGRTGRAFLLRDPGESCATYVRLTPIWLGRTGSSLQPGRMGASASGAQSGCSSPARALRKFTTGS